MSDTITPTQADRDAADYVGTLTEERRLIVAEAFARHRIAAYEAGKLEGARLMQEAAAECAEFELGHASMVRVLNPAIVLRNSSEEAGAAGGDA